MGVNGHRGRRAPGTVHPQDHAYRVDLVESFRMVVSRPLWTQIRPQFCQFYVFACNPALRVLKSPPAPVDGAGNAQHEIMAMSGPLSSNFNTLRQPCLARPGLAWPGLVRPGLSWPGQCRILGYVLNSLRREP